MSTPATDAKPLPTTCVLCTKALKHADVVLIGHSDTNEEIAVHPNCLMPGVNDKIKDLKVVHVHVEPGKRISPAKQLVVRKTIKAIYKAIAMANAKRQQEAKS